MKHLKIILFTLFCLLPVLLPAQVDSSAYEGKAGVADVAEEDPGLFLLMMFMLMGAVIAVFICLGVGLLLSGIISLMIAAGIVSISAFMAWYNKSIYAGVKWFVYLTFAIIGIAGGIVGSLLIGYFRDYTSPTREMFLWSIPAGLIGGLIAAWAIIKIGNLVYKRVAAIAQ
jgi:hypothetical protein